MIHADEFDPKALDPGLVYDVTLASFFPRSLITPKLEYEAAHLKIDPMQQDRVFAPDGGLTWRVQASWTYHSFTAVTAWDANHCWVMDADGNVLYTTNGGATWYTTRPTSEALLGVTSLPSGLGWAVGTSGLLLSSWGGSSWSQSNGSPWPAFTFYAVSFSDTMRGYALGDRGSALYSTSDGGKT